jgi:hypothetical protein
MKLFTEIPDAIAILRLPKGVFKQSKVFGRGDRLYVAGGGGFVEIRYADHDGQFVTTHPAIKVVEFEVPHPARLSQERVGGSQLIRYRA